MTRLSLETNGGRTYVCCSAANFASTRRLKVKSFENAASLLLAMAAQVLAIGVVLAL
jgi:hypothetical protein